MADITLRILGQEPLPLNLGSDNSETLSVGSGVTEGRLQEVLTDYVPKSDIDTTLSISGDVAEAKATGDAIAEINSKLADILPSDSASGAIASFSDGAKDFPLKSLEVEIEPKQSGSGTPSPSNVRPITGWDSVSVTRTGKNLLDESTVESGLRSNSVGADYDNITASTRYAHYGKVDAKQGLVFSFTSSDVSVLNWACVICYNGSKVTTQKQLLQNGVIVNGQTYTITIDANLYDFVSVDIGAPAGVSVDATKGHLQIELGSTATAYSPYTGETYTIPLPSTVYGGVLNVDSGVLTVTHLMNTFTGASGENWTKSSSTAVDRYLCLTSDIFDNTNGTAISNIYPQTNYGGASLNRFYFDNSNNTHRVAVNFAPAGTTSATDIKTFLSSNNLTVVGKLATPITIPLTPTEIKTLLGENNIWADSGNVSVVYHADIGKYIDKRLGS